MDAIHSRGNPAFTSITPVSTLVPRYHLSGFGPDRKLVQVGEEDFQEKVDSSRGLAFDAILDRFLEDGTLPQSCGSPDDYTDLSFLYDKLDLASSFVENMEEVREVYNLPDDWTYDQIRSYLNDSYSKLQGGDIDGEKKKDESSEPESSESSETETSC